MIVLLAVGNFSKKKLWKTRSPQNVLELYLEGIRPQVALKLNLLLL